VKEVMRDVLQEAMDLEGLKAVLAAMHDGRIRCVAVDTTTPSAFAHELINANPYAFLDDAGLEERRARAVQMRGVVPDAVLGEAGRLSQEAIAEVRQEVWPDIRDEHELHDLLCALVVVPAEVLSWNEGCRDWDVFLGRLERVGRVAMARRTTPGNEGRTYFVAAERAEWLRGLWADVEFSVEMLKMPGEVPDNSDILKRLLQGWLQITGPVTSAGIGERLGLDAGAVWQQMVRLESTGTILRGGV
jgi:ATP-dependent Lhr-like helicase